MQRTGRITLGLSLVVLLGCGPVACDALRKSPPPDVKELWDPDAGDPNGCGCPGDNTGWTVGRRYCTDGAHEGYTLFAPMRSDSTYLVDRCGRRVHSWASTARPALSVYLLDNGNLLRTEIVEGGFSTGSGGGGRVVELDWDGNVVWEYYYTDTEHLLHHDIEPLPGGNVLMIAWERQNLIAALEAGRDLALLPEGELWPDTIIEVQPDPPSGGTIVWQWRVWDHLIQDHDPTKANFGDVADHPELIDLNFAYNDKPDWTHVNSVDYHPQLDQILLSVPSLREVWIIDHSTTTAEAAGHTGGRSGRGGDLLYQWGNPRAYDTGTRGDQQLFFQHDARWIKAPLPSAGPNAILLFNNGNGRPGDARYSTVDELLLPAPAADGTYPLDVTFAPSAPSWQYRSDPPEIFFGDHVSGAQRLPNGNTLICIGPEGIFFEVTADGTVVWEYVNPVLGADTLTQFERVPRTPSGRVNSAFRATRLTADHPGLSGRDLSPGDYLELPAD